MNIKNITNIIGMNYRMTNLECAVANEQLKITLSYRVQTRISKLFR